MAAFPDVVPSPPAQAERPPEDLLRASPYGDASERAPSAAANLSNPYIDELRLVSSEAVRSDSPYAAILRSPPDSPYAPLPRPPLKEPYDAAPAIVTAPPSGEPAALKSPYPEPSAVTPSPAGHLVLDLQSSFRGVVLVDGITVPRGAPVAVSAGPHTVSVFPAGAQPYQIPVTVRPGSTERIVIP